MYTILSIIITISCNAILCLYFVRNIISLSLITTPYSVNIGGTQTRKSSVIWDTKTEFFFDILSGSLVIQTIIPKK